MLDILGAETRLKEYGLLLFDQINRIDVEDWLPYAENIPVSFEKLCKIFCQTYLYSSDEKWREFVFTNNICLLGSKPLLTYRTQIYDLDINKAFLSLCSFGHFELAFELIIIYKFRIQNRQSLFQFACKYGQLTIAQEFYQLGIMNSHIDHESIFRSTCENGHLSVCQWLYTIVDGKININCRYDAFIFACSKGHLIIAKWLFTLDTFENFLLNGHLEVFGKAFEYFEIENWFYEINFLSKVPIEKLFQMLCLHGNLPGAQRLYSTFHNEINIHGKNDFAFINACQSGNFELIQWLYDELGRGGRAIDIHFHNDSPFIKACGSKDIRIAKWLFDMGHVNIHTKQEAFLRAARTGQLEIAKWLYYEVGGKETINIHVDNDAVFRYAMTTGPVELIDWLYSLGGFESLIQPNSYRRVIRQGQLNLAQWLFYIIRH
jgi:hypothetical protein